MTFHAHTLRWPHDPDTSSVTSLHFAKKSQRKYLSSSRTIDLSHSAFTEKAHDLECTKLGADSDSHGLSFQFKMSVMGEAVASSVVTLIRNRPSEATAYC